MSNKKQTAVEWLMSELWIRLNMGYEWKEKVFDQAKEMEKEQIMDALSKGQMTNIDFDGEQYYKETYEQ